MNFLDSSAEHSSLVGINNVVGCDQEGGGNTQRKSIFLKGMAKFYKEV
jgi:hypothetical protein